MLRSATTPGGSVFHGKCAGALGVMAVLLLVVILFSNHSKETNSVKCTTEIQQVPKLVAAEQSSATSGKLFTGKKVATYDKPFQFVHLHSLNHSQDLAHVKRDKLLCDRWAVVTTIFEPTDAVKKQATLNCWCLVVVGDKIGPKSYETGAPHDNFVFLDAARQAELSSELNIVNRLPWNHFGRKNVGYLYAVLHGAKIVYDFDDDNLMFKEDNAFFNMDVSGLVGSKINSVKAGEKGKFVGLKCKNGKQDSSATTSAVAMQVREPVCDPKDLTFNPMPIWLPQSTGHAAWPRGYPLMSIKTPRTFNKTALPQQVRRFELPASKVGVVQFLADHDPDVDAIYRLTQELPFYFLSAAEGMLPMVLPYRTRSMVPTGGGASAPSMRMVYTPYNAQTTLHMYNALWGMLLPVTVHGRVSDIWRSYFVQRLFQDVGVRLVFDSPAVVQHRNAHNYLADLQSEEPLYKRSQRLVEQLDEWEGRSCTFPGRIEELWVMLYEHGYIEVEDVDLLQAWIKDLLLVNYTFPLLLKVPGHCVGKVRS